MLTDQDYVITVCVAAHETLGSTRRLHWSVPDPVPIGTQAAFDTAFEDIACRNTGTARTPSLCGPRATSHGLILIR